MLSGLNADIEFSGNIFHVQTEDGGKMSPSVVTTLFSKGAILTQRKTSYAEKVDSSNLRTIVKDLMNEQHRKMIDDLKAGKLPLGSKKKAPEGSTVPTASSESRPKSKPATKSLDDLILNYLSNKEDKDS